ncbi:hypothetical protein ACGVWS_04245 [Enterobacteriaceae bacterium LUAb1]
MHTNYHRSACGYNWAAEGDNDEESYLFQLNEAKQWDEEKGIFCEICWIANKKQQ